jgi:hypothetical protein
LDKERNKILTRRTNIMIEDVYAENFFGVKSYYSLNVILKNETGSVLVVKDWQNNLKKLKYNETKKCYIVDKEL